ncbi:MAG: hypothetical protein KGL39_43805 [Patescibacteria group bacterium]|nr:hypothetical protein [Patescibacteria group bacterium]
MTDEQLVNEYAADCDMSAQDCKGNADYAAYSFKNRDFEKARQYVARLEDNLSRLKSNLRSLDRAIEKAKSA